MKTLKRQADALRKRSERSPGPGFRMMYAFCANVIERGIRHKRSRQRIADSLGVPPRRRKGESILADVCRTIARRIRRGTAMTGLL